MALDTKYRPKHFTDVIGQDGSVKVLRQFVRSGTGFHQSYLFCGFHGSGKCITGDTLVPTNRGLVPIVSLMGSNQVDPLDVRVVQETGTANAAYSYRDGVRDTIRITTHNGFTLEGTPAHRIRIMGVDGTIVWRTLGEMQVGDYACIVRRGMFGTGADLSGWAYQPHPASSNEFPFDAPATLDPEWGRIIGYMVGDGSCTSKQGITIACADPEVLSDLQYLLETKTGSCTFTPDKRRPGLHSVRAHRVHIRRWLDYAGLGYHKAGDKCIPWSILASPEDVVRQFLRGYFESDGHVSKAGVEITTKSEQLSRQLQVALLNFGVVSSRRLKPVKGQSYWRVCIRGTSFSAFCDRIGFVSRRKQEALERLVAQASAKTGRINNRRETVPHQERAVQDLYLRRKGSPTIGRLCRSRFGFGCSRDVVHALAEIPGSGADLDHFRALWDADYFYDPITTITTGRAEVYDLNVPEGEMFASNGFMSHNTTMGRILARALLCEAPVDGNPCDRCDSCTSILERGSSECFTEFDAATNSGKDAIKSIVDNIHYDTFSGKRRIYLMDEAHRLSKEALDALLKPMEDTVPGGEDKLLVCIFCTTEPEKMRSTIFSRCAPAFVIRRVSPEGIADRLTFVCEQEGIPYERDALVLIAEATECHIRDGLKALEGVWMLGGATVDNVRQYLRLNVNSLYLDMLSAIGTDMPRLLDLADQVLQSVSPSTAYERLAEATMLAYRVSLGAARPPSYWSKEQLDAIGKLHQDQLVRFAEVFASRPGNPIPSMLSCDLAMLHHTRVGAWVAPTITPQVATVFAPPVVNSPSTAQMPLPVSQLVENSNTPPIVRGNVSETIPTPTPKSTPVKAGVNSAGVYIDPRAVGKRDLKNDLARTGGINPMEADEFRRALSRLFVEYSVNGGGSSA
jgi:DNA polymerase III subunit gamma/tau